MDGRDGLSPTKGEVDGCSRSKNSDMNIPFYKKARTNGALVG
jgi:hypothetical protein